MGGGAGQQQGEEHPDRGETGGEQEDVPERTPEGLVLDRAQQGEDRCLPLGGDVGEVGEAGGR